jgi:putative addiction module component (TIGR02574 family)
MKRSRIWFQASGLRAMSALLKSIEEQARALSAEDRARLAESMLESLHTSIAEIEALWAEEIEERVSAFDRGEITSYPAEEVIAEARRSLQ